MSDVLGNFNLEAVRGGFDFGMGRSTEFLFGTGNPECCDGLE